MKTFILEKFSDLSFFVDMKYYQLIGALAVLSLKFGKRKVYSKLIEYSEERWPVSETEMEDIYE